MHLLDLNISSSSSFFSCHFSQLIKNEIKNAVEIKSVIVKAKNLDKMFIIMRDDATLATKTSSIISLRGSYAIHIYKNDILDY